MTADKLSVIKSPAIFHNTIKGISKNYYFFITSPLRGCLKSQFDCHIEFIEILTIKLIAFDKLRLTVLSRQPQG